MIHAVTQMMTSPAQVRCRPLDNVAVARCQVAWERAYRSVMKMTKSRMLARKNAREAFQLTLPSLSGLENIGNFIACVAHAISTGVFVNGEDAELLLSASIALRAITRRSLREIESIRASTPPPPPQSHPRIQGS